MVSHQDGLSPEWSVIRVVCHQGALSPGCSVIRVVCHRSGLSAGWSVTRMVCHQGGLSSGWWFVIKVVSSESGLSSWVSLYYKRQIYLCHDRNIVVIACSLEMYLCVDSYVSL